MNCCSANFHICRRLRRLQLPISQILPVCTVSYDILIHPVSNFHYRFFIIRWFLPFWLASVPARMCLILSFSRLTPSFVFPSCPSHTYPSMANTFCHYFQATQCHRLHAFPCTLPADVQHPSFRGIWAEPQDDNFRLIMRISYALTISHSH